jgi:hypothetical protein
MFSKKQNYDLKFIQQHVIASDYKDVVQAAGRFTTDYVHKCAKAERRNDELLALLHKCIELRLKQRQERIEKLKQFNFNNPKK